LKIKTEATFDSAHFVQTTHSKCRRLHGHTWKVEVMIQGPVDKDGMVVDFLKIKSVIDELDHKILLPTMDYAMGISCKPIRGKQQKMDDIELVKVSLDEKYYVFPSSDIKWIATDVITSENLAKYLLNKIKENAPETLIVTVRMWETPKSWAEVTG